MAPKKRKASAAPVDSMKQFDRQYYELTITDLNNKLAHLRSFNATTEERNIELEANMKQMEEDRTDVTAFLDRSLTQKVSINKDLEEKLDELAKLRANEKTEFLRQIREGELKYKTMQEELTSEIKLLTGKLNSLEEFRVQKDELLAKFDQQESELRVQTKQHRDLIYDIERKQVMDKDRLKKEVENKLLELSNEFAKSNEIRISAHVQRLVRENIALNNELDRMMFSQRRLQDENKNMISENSMRRSNVESYKSENDHLVRVCDKQVTVIRKLTSELEGIRAKNALLCEADNLRTLAEKRDHSKDQTLSEFQRKVHLLEQHVQSIRGECVRHETMYKQQTKEMQRLTGILLKLKFTVKSAARGEKRQLADDPEFRKAQRENLLADLMRILTLVYEIPEPVSSIETVGSLDELYKHGDIGITPDHSLTSILKTEPIGRIHESRMKASVMMALEEASAKKRASQLSFPIIDLESGSLIVISESSQGEAPPDENELEEAEDMGVSSSDDEQAAAKPTAAPQAAVVSKAAEVKFEEKKQSEIVFNETENIKTEGDGQHDERHEEEDKKDKDDALVKQELQENSDPELQSEQLKSDEQQQPDTLTQPEMQPETVTQSDEKHQSEPILPSEQQTEPDQPEQKSTSEHQMDPEHKSVEEIPPE